MVSDAFRIQHHAAQETILFRHFRICSYCCHDRLLTQGCSDGVDHGHLGSFRSATAALREVQIGGNYGLQHIETMVYIGLCLVFVSLHVFSHGFNGFIYQFDYVRSCIYAWKIDEDGICAKTQCFEESSEVHERAARCWKDGIVRQ